MVKREQNGLYNATNEHDACGVGMVVNIHGNKSHELVDSALKVLENMRHAVRKELTTKPATALELCYKSPTNSSFCKASPYREREIRNRTSVSAQR